MKIWNGRTGVKWRDHDLQWTRKDIVEFFECCGDIPLNARWQITKLRRGLKVERRDGKIAYKLTVLDGRRWVLLAVFTE